MLNEASFSTDTLAWVRVKSLIAPGLYCSVFSTKPHFTQTKPTCHFPNAPCPQLFQLLVFFLTFLPDSTLTEIPRSSTYRPLCSMPIMLGGLSVICTSMVWHGSFLSLIWTLEQHFKAAQSISFPKIRALTRGCRWEWSCQLFIS